MIYNCDYINCNDPGIHRINPEAKTIDKIIVFCDTHYPEMNELYWLIKGIEYMDGWDCIMSPYDFWQIILHQMNGKLDFFIDLRNMAEISIKLRIKFQDHLK